MQIIICMGYYKLKPNNISSQTLFDSFFNDFDYFFKSVESDTYNKQIKSDGDSYIAEISIPGVSKDKLSIEATEEELIISKDNKAIKQISLNGLVDIDEISSDLNLGVLKITLPKKESQKPKKIKIK